MRFLIQTLLYALLLAFIVWCLSKPAEFERIVRSLM
jgi:hypothetical protein